VTWPVFRQFSCRRNFKCYKKYTLCRYNFLMPQISDCRRCDGITGYIYIYIYIYILPHICRDPGLWDLQWHPSLRNGSTNTPLTSQWLGTLYDTRCAYNGSRHAVPPSTSLVARRWRNIHLSGTAVTSFNKRRIVGSGVLCWVRPEAMSPRAVRENVWDGAVRKVGCWCEMAASLRGREAGSRGTSTVGRGYPAAKWRPWLGTPVCVW
jgi:hypothetical protein